MHTLRQLLGLLLMATGGLVATAMGFQMLLTAAYMAWGLAFAYCMGTALASMVLCAGFYVLLGRLPGFMLYTGPVAHATRTDASPPPPPPRFD